MTTITQTDIGDITGMDDNRSWTFFVPQMRQSDSGTGLVTPKKDRKYPISGVLTVELDPGPAAVLAPDGKTYPFTVPDTDSDLWSLIQAAVTIPPSTTHQQLLDAVAAWLEVNTILWDSVTGKPALVAPLKNTAVAIGDSITLGGDNASHPKQLGFAWFHNICIASNQRIQDAGLFATSGYTLEQIRTIHLPSVLAMNPRPGACFVLGGANDILAAGTALSAMQTSVKAIVSTLRAAGITPVLLTVTPCNPSDPTVTGKIGKHNTWLLRYAAQNGISIVDSYRAVVDPVGGLKAVYDGGDHVHPNSYGHKAIAQQAMRDGLPDIFPVAGSMTVKSSIDLTNMLNNGTTSYGIFNVDTNADGVSDGWTTTGTGTVSRVTPDPSDELSGMWQQLARTTGQTSDLFVQSQALTTGYSTGDVLALSYRVQTQEMQSSVTWWGCYAYLSGADRYMGCLTQYADEDGLVYVEFPVPAGTTQIQINAQVNGVGGTGNPKLRIGEISLRNLTTNALLGV